MVGLVAVGAERNDSVSRSISLKLCIELDLEGTTFVWNITYDINYLRRRFSKATKQLFPNLCWPCSINSLHTKQPDFFLSLTSVIRSAFVLRFRIFTRSFINAKFHIFIRTHDAVHLYTHSRTMFSFSRLTQISVNIIHKIRQRGPIKLNNCQLAKNRQSKNKIFRSLRGSRCTSWKRQVEYT